MRITWLNLCALKNLGHPWISNARCREQFFPLQTPGCRAYSSSAFCSAAGRVTTTDLMLPWSSPCHPCAAALNFTNCSNSPLLSKSREQGVCGVVSVLWSRGNKTDSLTRGCAGCETRQSITGCGNTKRVLAFNCTYSAVVLRQSWSRGTARARAQHCQDPRALANPVSSARGHLWALRSCATLSTCHIVLGPNDRNAATLCRVRCLARNRGSLGTRPGRKQTMKILNCIITQKPSGAPQQQMNSTAWAAGSGLGGRLGHPALGSLGFHRVAHSVSPRLRERLFQPILYNINLPKSGKRAPFCVFPCSAKVLHLNWYLQRPSDTIIFWNGLTERSGKCWHLQQLSHGTPQAK